MGIKPYGKCTLYVLLQGHLEEQTGNIKPGRNIKGTDHPSWWEHKWNKQATVIKSRTKGVQPTVECCINVTYALGVVLRYL